MAWIPVCHSPVTHLVKDTCDRWTNGQVTINNDINCPDDLIYDLHFNQADTQFRPWSSASCIHLTIKKGETERGGSALGRCEAWTV